MSSASAASCRPDEVCASSLEVHLLGVVDYDAALRLQEQLVFDVSGRTDTQGTLLLCEHPPGISIGREGSRAHILADVHDLEACELDVRWIARGGGVFVHAPGQLAVYPILPLDRLSMGLAQYRDRVEEALLLTCRDLRVPATQAVEAPGLWCRGGQLASFGVAVKGWTTYHGAYLNVATDPSFLSMVESSPVGERLTSLQSQLRRPVRMHKVREAVVRYLAAGLGYERMHVYTGHPLLKRTMQKVCLHA
jgi:lipoate-protein ligase B